MSYFKRVAALTPTAFWINNVTRHEARLAIEAGATGCTQNPAYLSKVLCSPDDGPSLLAIADGLIAEEPDDYGVVDELQRRAIAGICEEFHPMYEESGGRRGLVSIQANPFREDVATILENAEKSLTLAENFIIKIPATLNGLEAMEVLIGRGVPVLATEVMSIDQMLSVCELHRTVTKGMKHPAPFWVAHINGIFDEHLEVFVQREGVAVSPDVLRLASLALARKIHGYLREKDYEVNYMAGGARGLHHFTGWVGARGAVTINWKGTADKLLEADPPVSSAFTAETPFAALDELLAKLPDFQTAWTPGALKVEEYEYFGPVVRFRNAFEQGWSLVQEAVAARRLPEHGA